MPPFFLPRCGRICIQPARLPPRSPYACAAVAARAVCICGGSGAGAGSRRWFGNAFGVLAGGIDRLVRRLLGCGLQRELGDIIELFRVAFGVCSI